MGEDVTLGFCVIVTCDRIKFFVLLLSCYVDTVCFNLLQVNVFIILSSLIDDFFCLRSTLSLSLSSGLLCYNSFLMLFTTDEIYLCAKCFLLKHHLDCHRARIFTGITVNPVICQFLQFKLWVNVPNPQYSHIHMSKSMQAHHSYTHLCSCF